MGIGISSKCVRLWAMPKDNNMLEDGQWDCWAWVNGPRIGEKNDGSALISEDLGHLRKSPGKVA